MVKDSRTAVRTDRLRPLAGPRRIAVQADGRGRPRAVLYEGTLRDVAVQDRWRIDDEWWRERPVSRMYFRLQLAEGRVITVYRDLAGGDWWEQRY